MPRMTAATPVAPLSMIEPISCRSLRCPATRQTLAVASGGRPGARATERARRAELRRPCCGPTARSFIRCRDGIPVLLVESSDSCCRSVAAVTDHCQRSRSTYGRDTACRHRIPASTRSIRTRASDEAHYKAKLKEYQLRLIKLQLKLAANNKHSLIVVAEGPDAAGKGGAIKRLVEKLDPRTVRVYSTIKPTAEEYGHHYLWRFWNRLPPRGQIAVFDRSWYGRVLVERVEGFATEAEWRRAYRESTISSGCSSTTARSS